MESRQGIVITFNKPDIKVSDSGDIEVIPTEVSRFFTLEEIKTIIEAKERQNLSSRMCYYKKKNMKRLLETTKNE